MEPQKKNDLTEFVMAAKEVIYNPGRMDQMLPMMDTKAGAIKAVQAIIAAIEQTKPVPPSIAPLLGVSTYMLLVDVAREATGMEPDPKIVKGVGNELLSTMRQSHGEKGEPAAAQMGEQQAGVEPPEGEAGISPAGGLIGHSMRG